MRRTVIAVGWVGAVALLGLVLRWNSPTTAQDPAPAPNNAGNGRPPAATLPIAQVVLFSSGVGYFQREGDVEGSSAWT